MKRRKRGLGISAIITGLLTCLCLAVASQIKTPATSPPAGQSDLPTLENRPTKIITPFRSYTPKPTNLPLNASDGKITLIPITPSPTTRNQPALNGTATWTPLAKGFDVIEIPITLQVGGFARVAIHTQPGVTCNIVFKLPSGRVSSDDGLRNQTADKLGMCKWAWKLMGNIKPGRGSFTIWANGAELTQSVTLEK